MSNRFAGLATRYLVRSQTKTILLPELLQLEYLSKSQCGNYVKELVLLNKTRDHRYYDEARALMADTTFCSMATSLRSALQNLSQLESIGWSTGFGFDPDGEEVLENASLVTWKLFLHAFRDLELPNLTEIIFYLNHGRHMAELVKSVQQHAKQWKAICYRIRRLSICQGGIGEHREGHDFSPAKNLTALLKDMEGLKFLEVFNEPSIWWPSGREGPCNLRTLCLSSLISCGDHLASFIQQNSDSLQTIGLYEIRLESGFWEQVLISMRQCRDLKYVELERLAYSQDHDWYHFLWNYPAVSSRSSNYPQMYKYWHLGSYLWADWHALRDLTLSLGLEIDEVRQRMTEDYCSLRDYHENPQYKQQREHDRERITGRALYMSETIPVPPGVNYSFWGKLRMGLLAQSETLKSDLRRREVDRKDRYFGG